MLAKLERIHVFQDHGPQLSHNISNYQIKGDIGLSNYFSIFLSLKLKQGQKKVAKWKMNIRYLKEAKLEIVRTWELMPNKTSRK